MPHTGKPSGACQQCRKSHAKCDEARPACGRCIKANKICSGYAEGLDLVLRQQNETAKAQVDRRQRITNKSDTTKPERRVVYRPPSPPISPSLPESEESHAVNWFVSSFALYPRDTQADRGFIELLPLLYSSLKHGSPLALALVASSRAIYGKWEHRRKDAETLALPDFGNALAATRKALEDPEQSSSDETLMAICLLGFYEATTSAFKSQISPIRHFQGAAALIKQRRNKNMTEITNRLLIAVRSNIVFRAMQFAEPLDGTSDILDDNPGVPQNPGTLLDLMCVEVANLLADAKRFHAIGSASPTDEASQFKKLYNLMFKAQSLDAKLMTWPNFLPASWVPVRLPAKKVPKSVIETGFYGEWCDIYPDIMVCSTWNEWRVARLMVLNLIIQLSHTKSGTKDIDAIQELVDEICHSVPFSLGDRTEPGNLYGAQIQYPCLPNKPMSKEHQKTATAYGGWYLFAPFKEIMNVARYLRKGQHEWILGQLARLAKMYDVAPNLSRS
ncbi:hypothetical protein ACLMJK_007399 [Lecanora helva]